MSWPFPPNHPSQAEIDRSPLNIPAAYRQGYLVDCVVITVLTSLLFPARIFAIGPSATRPFRQYLRNVSDFNLPNLRIDKRSRPSHIVRFPCSPAGVGSNQARPGNLRFLSILKHRPQSDHHILANQVGSSIRARRSQELLNDAIWANNTPSPEKIARTPSLMGRLWISERSKWFSFAAASAQSEYLPASH